MITRIEALNYRCLRYIRQDLGPFHVLVGPNASGKTTFLDVVAFLGRMVTDGPEAAVIERTQNFEDLVWGRRGDRFELAIEAAIPGDRTPVMDEKVYETVRYEVTIGQEFSGDIAILDERVVLVSSLRPANGRSSRGLFPKPPTPPANLRTQKSRKDAKIVIQKDRRGIDRFYSEWASGPNKLPAFKLGPRKSALGNLPSDEVAYPVATWLKELLRAGVQQLALNSQALRRASPPLGGRRFSATPGKGGEPRRGRSRARMSLGGWGFRSDGSNLPWLIESLRRGSPGRFREWIGHLQTALPDLEDIRTIERPDDKHRYLMIGYRGGLEVPSWVASDGTLRLLALTLPAYLGDFAGIYLIEEPEDGIHPRAVETMFQSLSSVYDVQVLLATHSPVILNLADPSTVLCFAKTEDEATGIVVGSQHPALRDWHGESNLGVLFAAGVLG
jgi:predicted ATPase